MMMMGVLVFAAALSAGNAEFDRVAAEGAARITLERVTAELKTQGPAAGVLAVELISQRSMTLSPVRKLPSGQSRSRRMTTLPVLSRTMKRESSATGGAAIWTLTA